MQDCLTLTGAGLMNSVTNYASIRPSNPLRCYSYVHDSKLQQLCQIVATMHKTLSVTTVTAYGRLYLAVTGNPLGFSFTSAMMPCFSYTKTMMDGECTRIKKTRIGNFGETQPCTLVSQFMENKTLLQLKHSSTVTDQKKARCGQI